MSVALEGIPGVLLIELLPFANDVWVQFVFTGGLGDGFTPLGFPQRLLLELFVGLTQLA